MILYFRNVVSKHADDVYEWMAVDRMMARVEVIVRNNNNNKKSSFIDDKLTRPVGKDRINIASGRPYRNRIRRERELVNHPLKKPRGKKGNGWDLPEARSFRANRERQERHQSPG